MSIAAKHDAASTRKDGIDMEVCSFVNLIVSAATWASESYFLENPTSPRKPVLGLFVSIQTWELLFFLHLRTVYAQRRPKTCYAHTGAKGLGVSPDVEP